MSKIFKVSILSHERIYEICSNGNGSYTYDFTNATAERLERASKGYTREALEALAGRYVIFESYYDGERTRATPIPEQFKPSERTSIMIDGASFSALALDSFRAVIGNGLFRSAGKCFQALKLATFAENVFAFLADKLSRAGLKAICATSARVNAWSVFIRITDARTARSRYLTSQIDARQYSTADARLRLRGAMLFTLKMKGRAICRA